MNSPSLVRLVHQALVQSIWCKGTWWFLRRSLVLGSSGWWLRCCQKQRLSQNLFHGCSLGTRGILKHSLSSMWRYLKHKWRKYVQTWIQLYEMFVCVANISKDIMRTMLKPAKLSIYNYMYIWAQMLKPAKLSAAEISVQFVAASLSIWHYILFVKCHWNKKPEDKSNRPAVRS